MQSNHLLDYTKGESKKIVAQVLDLYVDSRFLYNQVLTDVLNIGLSKSALVDNVLFSTAELLFDHFQSGQHVLRPSSIISNRNLGEQKRTLLGGYEVFRSFRIACQSRIVG